jgi:hypothetical protein
MSFTELPRYRYRIDEADRLVWVDALWLAFAQENGAAELTEESVLGRSLWDYVAGDEIRRLYMEINGRVRLTGRSVILPFRCDSPTLQRHMRMTITRGDAGQLLYESLLVRTRSQRHLGVLDSARARSASFLTVCSCCKKALLETVGWLDLEDIAVRLGLFEMQKAPTLRHTVCPTCVRTLLDAAGNGNAA